MRANGPASPGRWHDVQLWNTIGAICSVKVSPEGLATSPAEKAVTARAQAAASIVRVRLIFSLQSGGCNSRWLVFGRSILAYRSEFRRAPFVDHVQWLPGGACRAQRRRCRCGLDIALGRRDQ